MRLFHSISPNPIEDTSLKEIVMRCPTCKTRNQVFITSLHSHPTRPNARSRTAEKETTTTSYLAKLTSPPGSLTEIKDAVGHRTLVLKPHLQTPIAPPSKPQNTFHNRSYLLQQTGGHRSQNRNGCCNGICHRPQQCLYFFPLPHGQGSLGAIFLPTMGRTSPLFICFLPTSGRITLFSQGIMYLFSSTLKVNIHLRTSARVGENGLPPLLLNLYVR